MKTVQRYDSVKVKAVFDEHGFLVDRPIVARIGLQEYRTPYGIRREFRPASEVFKSDSLESFAGKPVTLGHTTVTPENARSVVVGSCAGAGCRNGIGVEVPLSIYDKDAIESAKKKRTPELSVGYTSVDIDKPGWGNNLTGEYILEEDMKEDWEPDSPDWVKFDALQTDIRVNHVALVFKGRAGIAKLNLDSQQDFPYDIDVKTDEDIKDMIKIKLDGEVEFEVAKEVANYIDSLKADAAEKAGKVSSLEAERDLLKAKVDGIQEQIDEAVKKAKADAEAMAELVKTAGEIGVKTDGLSAKEIKSEYVKAVTGVDVSAKEDAYIDAAFDLAKASDKMAAQRIAINGNAEDKNDAADEDLDPFARLQNI